jgi:hypothetical protein
MLMQKTEEWSNTRERYRKDRTMSTTIRPMRSGKSFFFHFFPESAGRPAFYVGEVSGEEEGR